MGAERMGGIVKRGGARRVEFCPTRREGRDGTISAAAAGFMTRARDQDKPHSLSIRPAIQTG